MTVTELQWLVGVSLTTVLAIASIAFTAFRAMSARLDRAVDKLEHAMSEGDANLHERINKVRDTYVRRDDLNQHLAGIDKKLDQITASQQEMTRTVIAALQSVRPH